MDIKIASEKFNSRYDSDISSYLEFCANNALSSKIKSLTQTHHILPRWAFEEYSNLNVNKWNSVILTNENHLIAHFILAKCWNHYNNYHSILRTFTSMTLEDLKSLNYLDTNLIEEYSIAKVKAAEDISHRMKNRTVTDETKDKYIKSRLGKKNTTKAKPSQYKGQTLTETHKANIAIGLSTKTPRQYICPHCSKSGNKTYMFKWHFDKCIYSELNDSVIQL